MSTGIILRTIGELKGIARNNWKLKEHNRLVPKYYYS